MDTNLLQTIEETVHSMQDEVEVDLLKVYDIHVLHSYICGLTSWYLAN
jgi:hypothetical protein